MNIAGRKSLISMSQMGIQKWRIVSIMDYDEMNSPLEAAQRATITAFVLITLGLLIVIPFISGSITKPIVAIKELMSRVTEGDLSVRAEREEAADEFSQLSASFNSMVEQLSELMKTVSDLKVREMALVLRQKEALIMAFQNQINPHLLYNTLDIRKSIAYLEDVPQIVTMTTNLAGIYRYNARFSDTEVTLHDEIAHLENYLKIIKVRFPKTFESRITVSEAHHSCLCQRLILQPIAENVVKYAIEPRGGKGAVTVSSSLDGNDLVIKIADDGPGIPEERLISLKQQFDDVSNTTIKYNEGNDNHGLFNVHARLVLKYGNIYGLHIDSVDGRSTVVSVRIPFRGKNSKIG
jgi:two-component system sensor histidine kinase YesM